VAVDSSLSSSAENLGALVLHSCGRQCPGCVVMALGIGASSSSVPVESASETCSSES